MSNQQGELQNADVTLTYKDDLYIVSNGKWYRKLKHRDMVTPGVTQFNAYCTTREWATCLIEGGERLAGTTGMYRDPCQDPRPPFQRYDAVMIARADRAYSDWTAAKDALVGRIGSVAETSADRIRVWVDGAAWLIPTWCLDRLQLSGPSNVAAVATTAPATTETITQEIWIPVKATRPLMLGDVPSSPEQPVLCWVTDTSIQPMYIHDRDVYRIDISGKGIHLPGVNPLTYKVFAQPKKPVTLADVPDLRIITATNEVEDSNEILSWFRKDGVWYKARVDAVYTRCTESAPSSTNWKLTDHVAKLHTATMKVIS